MPIANMIGIANGIGGNTLPYTSFAGLRGDWDANLQTYSDAGVTLTTVDDTPIPWWGDLSGHGFHFKHTTSVTTPKRKNNILNGFPVIRADGLAFLKATGIGTGWGTSLGTIIIVFRPSGVTQYGLIDFTLVTSPPSFNRYSGDGSGYFGVMRNVRLEGIPSVMPTTGNHIITIVSGASTYKVYDNGTLIGSASSDFGVPADMSIFEEAVTSTTAMDIARMSVFTRDLSTAELRVVHSQLGAKYGITVA